MRKLTVRLLLAYAALSVTACKDTDTQYTLYREGVDIQTLEIDRTKRIHIATFDAEIDAAYNSANCSFAEELFNANQPHYNYTVSKVRVRYWCEKGRYRK